MIGETKVSVRETLRYKAFAIYIPDERFESRLHKEILKFNKI